MTLLHRISDWFMSAIETHTVTLLDQHGEPIHAPVLTFDGETNEDELCFGEVIGYPTITSYRIEDSHGPA